MTVSKQPDLSGVLGILSIKRRSVVKRVFFLAILILISQPAQGENPGLSEAYENEIVEKIKGGFQTKEVKGKVERPICATPVYLEIKANWDRFSARAKAVLESYVERPPFYFPEHTYDTPQGHFKIHYVLDGDSAVYQANVDDDQDGHPDWVNTCGEVLEHVWDAEINVLGYNQPPSDGWYHDTLDNGGDGKYDVYLMNLQIPGYPPILGYTQGEEFVPSQSPSATSYIALDNDYVGFGSIHTQKEWLQVTFAHEFFHAVQLGYDGTEYERENERTKPYWMEMSAVWMEEMVYDDVNDYRGYLSAFFNEPWLSLKTFRTWTDIHPYGSCIWPIFLSERFDTVIIKDIWERCAEKAGDNAIEATDAALGTGGRGSNFEDAFREFTVWNYFTADRALTDTLPYSEGAKFYHYGTPAMVKVDTVHTEYPVDLTSTPHPPENLGANYVRFIPVEDLEGGIRIDFVGHSGEYKVSAVGYNPGYPVPFDTTFLINPVTQSGTGEVYDWNLYTEVIMIPAVVTPSPNQAFSYEYSADYDSSLHGGGHLPEQDEVLQNFPNPFVIEKESDCWTYFPFILKSRSQVRIDILTLSGERIKTIIPPNGDEFARGKYLDEVLAMRWDGRNENGEYVASGIYLYRFKTDRSTQIKKLAVIR